MENINLILPCTNRDAEAQRREGPTQGHTGRMELELHLELRSLAACFQSVMPPLPCKADFQSLVAGAMQGRMALWPGPSVLPLQARKCSGEDEGMAAYPREP